MILKFYPKFHVRSTKKNCTSSLKVIWKAIGKIIKKGKVQVLARLHSCLLISNQWLIPKSIYKSAICQNQFGVYVLQKNGKNKEARMIIITRWRRRIEGEEVEKQQQQEQ